MVTSNLEEDDNITEIVDFLVNSGIAPTNDIDITYSMKKIGFFDEITVFSGMLTLLILLW